MAKKYPITKKAASQIFGFSERTYQSWRTSNNESKKKIDGEKKHPIIDLLEKYISEEEIYEFLENNKIEKYEYIEYLYTMEKEKLLKMVEEILYNHSDEAKHILKLIQKYEQRYYNIKQKHIDAQNKSQSYIRYGDDEKFVEIQEYSGGYIPLDEYLTSIIFMPDKLSEILGKELLPKYLFGTQQAIQQIAKENLVPVIKRHMKDLLNKVESYKTEDEAREEYESEQQVEYQYDIETLTELLKKKKVIVPEYEPNPYGDIEILEDEDKEYVMSLHNDISKFEDMYPEKSYLELVDLAIKARPSSSMMQQKSLEGELDFEAFKEKDIET